MVYDFESTEWEAFKTVLKRECDIRLAMGMTLEERANEMQKICRKTCVKKIACKEIPQNWWNEDPTQAKRAVQCARRRLQITRIEEDKKTLVDLRRVFKTTIKISKEKHIQNITDSAIDPVHGTERGLLLRKKRRE